jgi:hypothetical protein
MSDSVLLKLRDKLVKPTSNLLTQPRTPPQILPQMANNYQNTAFNVSKYQNTHNSGQRIIIFIAYVSLLVILIDSFRNIKQFSKYHITILTICCLSLFIPIYCMLISKKKVYYTILCIYIFILIILMLSTFFKVCNNNKKLNSYNYVYSMIAIFILGYIISFLVSEFQKI